MKKLTIALMIQLAIIGGLLAQEPAPFSSGNGLFPENRQVAVSGPATRIYSHYENFYRETGNAELQFAPGYTGISATFLRLRQRQLAIGFAVQFNSVVSTNRSVRDAYSKIQPTGQSMFIPFLFNIKLHLTANASVQSIVPYVTAGLGPALGLYIPYGNNFFSTLGSISGQIGGGGFAGVGLDYHWQDEWAVSFDVRYNIFRFEQPVGLDKDYEGTSFFIGISRALDY